MVPVRCACPSQNQTANGVIGLVSYIPMLGDNLTRIGDLFGGLSPQSIMEANNVSDDRHILASTSLLVPLRSDNCTVKPRSSFCLCPDGQFGFENGYFCASDGKDGKGFPVKWVIILGMYITSLIYANIIYNIHRLIGGCSDGFLWAKQNLQKTIFCFFSAKTYLVFLYLSNLKRKKFKMTLVKVFFLCQYYSHNHYKCKVSFVVQSPL